MEPKENNGLADSVRLAQPEAHKKHSLGSRIVFALGFSAIGAKLSFLGIVADAAALLRDGPSSFWEKMRGVGDGTLVKRLQEEVVKITANAKSVPEAMMASAKIFKFTLITSIVGTVAGAVLGWVRGDRVKSVKDIFFHPIESLKLVFGLDSKDKKTGQASAATKSHNVAAQESPENSTQWRNYADQRKAASMSRETVRP